MRTIKRFTPITIGMLFQLLAVVLPTTLRHRLDLPWWPWHLVFFLPLLALMSVFLMYGIKYAREHANE